jgi:predicted small lipoprotein YifL
MIVEKSRALDGAIREKPLSCHGTLALAQTLALTLAMTLALSACGQKGPLYLPAPSDAPANAASVPAAEAP